MKDGCPWGLRKKYTDFFGILTRNYLNSFAACRYPGFAVNCIITFEVFASR
jgi:hypothetical protein